MDTTKGERIKPPQAVMEPVPGYYAVEGTQITRDGESKPYSGICFIDRINDLYICQWNLAGNAFVGAGLFRDGTLSVGWTSEDKMKGVYALKLLPDGSLDGRWISLPGNSLEQRETLKLLRKKEAKKKEV
jgi:hypothetical protein